jgi:hypothetical protein
MPNTLIQPLPFDGLQTQVSRKQRALRAVLEVDLIAGLLLSFLALLLMTITGCGSGGYPGGGIEALSTSAVTIDAGQSYSFTTMASNGTVVSYSLAGTTCVSGVACGSLSNTTGATVVYTAPAGITSQMIVTLTAAVTGTKSSATATITVNPDPTLASIPPTGTVGVAYTGSLSPAGGTAPLTLAITAGSIPPGLTFNATTGAITGTPTTVGTYTFTALLTDSSAVPYVVITQNSIVVAAPIPPPLAVSGNPPAGTVGSAYSTAFGASGGVAPYTFSVSSGSLPAGLTMSPGGIVAGTPSAAGVSVFTVQARDSVGTTGSASFSITITSASLMLTISSLPSGTVNVPYSATIGVTGGMGPYTCVVVGGTLPAGLSITGCLVNGIPTVAGTSNLTITATDSSSPKNSTTGPVSITINPAGSLTITSPPPGTVNIPYTGLIGVIGGTPPYACLITAGTLPAGLTISNCTISGTPTVPGTTTLTIKATDSSSPTALTTTGPVTLVISPAPLTLAITSLPNGTVNVPYSSTIGVNGGTAPYSCTITTGTLPAGLKLTAAGCLVSGTPTVAGTVNLTVKATDSSSPQETTVGPVSLTIEPASLMLTVSTLPNGTVNVPYTSTIGVTGGTSPYSCIITNGTLPAGLTLTSSGCLVSGTPTVAGTVKLTVKATDSSNPQETTTGPVSLTINPAAPTLTLTSPPPGTVNVPYMGTIVVSGGTAPYSCVITAGTLPAGLTISNCTISGTPTTAGTTTITVKGTDSGNPQGTVTGPVHIVINPTPLMLTVTSLPSGTVNVPYSSTIGVSGGTAPYSCTLVGAVTLPAGLTLTSAGCLVSGTPTVAGTVNLMVKATDSSNPQETTTGPVSLTINPAGSLTITSPPPGTVNVPYTGTIGVTGGTAPYTCTITAGTLPAGLTISNCTITGTPTTAGTTTLTVKATDSSNPTLTTTGPATLVINPPAGMLTLTSPPPATVGTPYTGTIGVSGGTGPYTCTVVSGTPPAGLTITNQTITGTPTTAGSTTIQVHCIDSSNPVLTVTGPVTITVQPVPPLTLNGTLPNATVNVPYSQTITAQGGLPPYTYAITAGTLPVGITLDPATGTFSGTPTVVGASSFTLTATDSEATPQTASLPLILQVVYATTPNDAELIGPYAYLFQGYDDVVAGVLAYQTATVGSFTASGTGVISAGEQDANDQGSNPVGETISSRDFLGTYTIGTDNRGLMAITVLNANGTTGQTTTYAIAVKAPVAPATVATQGSLIESDDNQIVGTKGSGTFLAQTPAAFAAGFNGSYAFGVSGDTPCLPSCTIGIIAGPVATVGQFTTNGAGALTAGTSDTNIATTYIPNSALSGTYTTADTNGRLALSLATADTPTNAYPKDFAVYVVNANQAFVMSTDKHSSYILLAGSTTLQTVADFGDAPLSGPFIGYENSQADPGLVGVTLQNVLNFSTATIFRGTGASNGNCTITNVDTGGVTSLISNLTGLGGSLTGLTAILGAYTQLGSATCPVTANGRGVLQYPVATLLGLPIGTPPAPRVFYLSSANTGYFLETSYAGLGKLEDQTGAPFSEANTFTGTYVYGSAPASSLASIDSSGIIVSNGAGSATTSLDLNIGVGTINVIELGQTSTQPYTAPNATSGRFTLGTAGNIVIYTINPNRFVLLDTNPLTTSPSVAVLY